MQVFRIMIIIGRPARVYHMISTTTLSQAMVNKHMHKTQPQACVTCMHACLAGLTAPLLNPATAWRTSETYCFPLPALTSENDGHHGCAVVAQTL